MTKRYIPFALTLAASLHVVLAQEPVVWMCPGGEAPQRVEFTTTVSPTAEEAPITSPPVEPVAEPAPETTTESAPSQPTETPPVEAGTIITSSLDASTGGPPATTSTYVTTTGFGEAPPIFETSPAPFLTGPTKTMNPGVGIGTGNTGLIGSTSTLDNTGWPAAAYISGGAGLAPTSTQSGGGGTG